MYLVPEATQWASTGWTQTLFQSVVQRAYAPRRSRSDFIVNFGQWPNLQLLIGMAYSWFAIDASRLLKIILVTND